MSSGPSETEKSGTDEGAASEPKVGAPSGHIPPRRAGGGKQISIWLANSFQRLSTLSRRGAHIVRDLVHRFTANVRNQATQFVTAATTRARATTLRTRNYIILFPLRAQGHFIRRRTFYLGLGSAFTVLITLVACWAGVGLWPIAIHYCTGLSPSTFQQVAVALGASVSGLLAIVFALTTFAIQQVAAREAAEVVLEYAQDRRMASTYWILAAIASICFALPFVQFPQDFLPTELVIFACLLILTFLLIYRHFKIVMLYSDPRFTVHRLYQRGMRDLRTAARTVDRVKRTIPDTQSETP